METNSFAPITNEDIADDEEYRLRPGEVNGRAGNAQKVWASQFTGKADVAHNLAYLRGVAMGFTKAEVIAAAGKARDEVRKPKPTSPRWIENEYTIINASDKGLILVDQTTMPWTEAAKVAGRLKVDTSRKENLLDKMRRLYAQPNNDRPNIATGRILLYHDWCRQRMQKGGVTL